MEFKKAEYEKFHEKQELAYKTFTKNNKHIERESFKNYMKNVKAHKEIMNNFYGKACKGSY